MMLASCRGRELYIPHFSLVWRAGLTQSPLAFSELRSFTPPDSTDIEREQTRDVAVNAPQHQIQM